MKNIFLAFFYGCLFVSSFAFGHGEDKLGPHKGFVRMPGAYHTEIVPDGKNKLKVFLLDIHWKNPSVVKSKLEIKYNDKVDAKCKIQDNFYVCVFPKSVDLTKAGELIVTAEREEQKGQEVLYQLPLKLEQAQEMQEGAHH